MAHTVQYIIDLRDRMTSGVQRIAGSITQLGTRVQQAQANINQAGRSIDSIGKRINTLTAQRNASTSISEIRRLNVEIRRLRGETERLENLPPLSFLQRIRQADGAFGSLAKTAMAGFSVMSMFEGLKGIAKLGIDAEQTKVSFDVMLGDANKASDMIAGIRNKAKVTPYSNDTLQKGAQTMLQFGVADGEILDNLSMLGDVAMGNKERFSGLTLAFAQMKATGRLMGQDLLQMVNQGFNPLMEISQMTGKSMAVLKKEMESGAISADMVTEAFRHATSEGGRFFGMSDRQSQTVGGKISVLLGNIQDKGLEMGTSMLPTISKILDFANKLVANFETLVMPVTVVANGISTVTGFLKENQAAQMGLIAALGIHRLCLIASVAATKGYTLTMQMQHYWTVICEKSTRLFNSTLLKNPILAIASGVVLLVGLLVTLRKRTDEANKGFHKMGEMASGFAASEVANIDKIFVKLRQTEPASKERISLVQQLKTEYPELNRQLEKELLTTNDLTPAYNALIEAAQRRSKVRALENITTEMMEAVYREKDDVRNKVEGILFSGSLKKEYGIPAGADRSYIRMLAERSARSGKSGDFAEIGQTILAIKSKEERIAAYNRDLAGLTSGSGASASANNTLIPDFKTQTPGMADSIQGGKGIKNYNVNVEALIKENYNQFDQSPNNADPEIFMDKLKQALMMVLNDGNYAI